MQNGFGIAVRAVNVPRGFQSGAKIGVIVNFTVVDDGQIARFIEHGLMAVHGNVDNTQAAVAQSNAAISCRGCYQKAIVIRATVSDGIGHGPDNSMIAGRVGRMAAEEKASNSAHSFSGRSVQMPRHRRNGWGPPELPAGIAPSSAPAPGPELVS